MKKIITIIIMTLIFAFSVPIVASALTVDGTVYNRNMWCAIVTGGFGKINGVNLSNDNGQTANLVGSSGTPIASYGYWYNSALGIDRSKQVGEGGYVNGGYAANVAKSTWQWNNINTGVGYQGSISSSYRGISQNIDQDLWSPNWNAGYNNLVWSFFLCGYIFSGGISGLDSSDKASARIVITGTGLPNSSSYGSSEKFSTTGTTSVSGIVRYGNYYVSVLIPNASKYSITYKVTYMRGDRYADRNNNYNYYNYNGSASFSSPLYYVESGGYLDVSITAKKKGGTVIADLYKGTGVTEPYENKTFYIYNSSGGYIKSATTDTIGYAYFYNMPYDTYSVKTSTPPTNHYYDPTSQNVSLTGDSVTAKFTLRKSTGNLQINYSTEDNLSLYNVRFKITNPDGGFSYYYTNSSGKITLSNIVVGTYRVEQMEAPTDYEKAGAVTATVYKGSTTTANVYNPILFDLSVELSAPATAVQMSDIPITVKYKNNGGKTVGSVAVLATFNGTTITGSNVNISIPANSTVTRSYKVSSFEMGFKAITTSINSARTLREVNYSNNIATCSINISTSTNLQIEYIPANSEYRQGTEVVSTFRVANIGYNNMTPAGNLLVSFVGYYIRGTTKIYIVNTSKPNVVIPANNDNLVYFKWTVPNSIAGQVVYFTATVNSTGTVGETDTSDDTVSFSRTIASVTNSQTPNTTYEEKTPSNFYLSDPPPTNAISATWSEWVFENNQFVRKSYGITIDDNLKPVLEPDVKSPSRQLIGGIWNIKSGYGYTLNYTSSYKLIAGYNAPKTDSYTYTQNASAFFPEYMYNAVLYQYRILQYLGTGKFTFFTNQFADSDARLHFIPIWFPDTSYYVSTYLYDFWTPAGMITARTTSYPMTVKGNIFEDSYVGGGK